MTDYLLDTNVLSASRRLMRQDEAFRSFMTSFRIEEAFLPAVALAEIGMGNQRQEKADAAFAADLRRWLDAIVLPAFAGRILAFDERAAAICGTLRTPNLAVAVDTEIASIALARDLVVLTRNVADFAPLGARIVDPWSRVP